MSRRRSISRLAAAGISLALVLLAALPGLVDAKILTWSISANRSSVSAGVATPVTLTISAPLVNATLINCVVVKIPGGAYALGATSYSDSRGSSFHWTVTTSPGTLTIKDANNNAGIGGLLSVSTLVVTVTVTGQVPGTANWSATAYDRFDCQHNPSPAPAIPMRVTGSLPTPTPTPAPTPTPTAVPTPTPAPTPTPTPAPTATPAPTPTHTPPPTPTPSPGSSARPTPTIGAGPTPTPSASDSPTPPDSPGPSAPASSAPSSSPSAGDSLPPGGTSSGSTGTGSGGSGTGSQPGGSTGLTVVSTGGGSAINVSVGGFSSGLGAFAWTVPGFLLGLPGLLVLLILGLQMGGAALFIPFTRRILGNSDQPRGRRTSQRGRRT